MFFIHENWQFIQIPCFTKYTTSLFQLWAEIFLIVRTLSYSSNWNDILNIETNSACYSNKNSKSPSVVQSTQSKQTWSVSWRASPGASSSSQSVTYSKDRPSLVVYNLLVTCLELSQCEYTFRSLIKFFNQLFLSRIPALLLHAIDIRVCCETCCVGFSLYCIIKQFNIHMKCYSLWTILWNCSRVRCLHFEGIVKWIKKLKN